MRLVLAVVLLLGLAPVALADIIVPDEQPAPVEPAPAPPPEPAPTPAPAPAPPPRVVPEAETPGGRWLPTALVGLGIGGLVVLCVTIARRDPSKK